MTFQEFLEKSYAHLRAHDCWVTEAYLSPNTHTQNHLEHLLNKDERYLSKKTMTFSVTWSLGGNSKNCYGDETQYEAQLEPEDPQELDLILEYIAPQMTHWQYKRIKDKVLLRETRSNSDYYGGSMNEGHKGFDIIALYEALKSEGLV